MPPRQADPLSERGAGGRGGGRADLSSWATEAERSPRPAQPPDLILLCRSTFSPPPGLKGQGHACDTKHHTECGPITQQGGGPVSPDLRTLSGGDAPAAPRAGVVPQLAARGSGQAGDPWPQSLEARGPSSGSDAVPPPPQVWDGVLHPQGDPRARTSRDPRWPHSPPASPAVSTRLGAVLTVWAFSR